MPRACWVPPLVSVYPPCSLFGLIHPSMISCSLVLLHPSFLLSFFLPPFLFSFFLPSLFLSFFLPSFCLPFSTPHSFLVSSILRFFNPSSCLLSFYFPNQGTSTDYLSPHCPSPLPPPPFPLQDSHFTTRFLTLGYEQMPYRLL